jgi:hypothetical protein
MTIRDEDGESQFGPKKWKQMKANWERERRNMEIELSERLSEYEKSLMMNHHDR